MSTILTARTPLHHWHTTHGAQFSNVNGWQIVKTYSSTELEVTAARSGLGLVDVSAFAKVRMRGKREAEKGRVRLLETPSERWLECSLTEDHTLLLASKPHSVTEPLISWPNCHATDVTSAYAGFIVVGLHLEALLRRLTHFDVRLVCWPENSCAETSLARVEALLVRYREFALPSVRIYVSWDMGDYVWERLLEAGRDWQISPMGLESLSTLALR